jgi:hypothetical protein
MPTHIELAAAIELRRRFPGITDNTKARGSRCRAPPSTVTRLRPGEPRQSHVHSPAVSERLPFP